MTTNDSLQLVDKVKLTSQTATRFLSVEERRYIHNHKYSELNASKLQELGEQLGVPGIRTMNHRLDMLLAIDKKEKK